MIGKGEVHMGLKTGQAGLDLIKQFEGCRLTAYRCPAGVWTIGYGHTAGVAAGQRITQEEADRLLVSDAEKYEKKVNKYHDRYTWRQNEFDALVSFAFNVGSIDQLTANGTRSRAVIAEKIMAYNKAAGKPLAGLTKRRQAEQNLFLCKSNARSTVKRGSRGEDVIYLQKQLAVLGYSVGNVDGIFGIKTLEAVKEFQAESGLDVDGIVGSKTWNRLFQD